MMSPEDRILEDLLYGGDLGNDTELGSGAPQTEENTAAGTKSVTSLQSLTPVSLQESMLCAGCGEQVCDRFFLLAAGSVWHNACLRCSQCHCELQTHPSLYFREGTIYCHQDYCRMFGGGQCAHCSQPIPASDLAMTSSGLNAHPHCFSCQECDVKLQSGNQCCLQNQNQNLCCQSPHHGDGSVLPSQNPKFKPCLKEAPNQISGEGEESLSSPEPRLDDRVAGEQVRQRTKRIRTCFRSEQVRMLESYFARKHNPDGKDWTCLAHKTGLPKRVLQVWFQNARAKLRRSLSAEDSRVSSPPAPPPGPSVATSSSPPAFLPDDQYFATSTINQLQLSLLTCPLGDSPVNPVVSQQSPTFFLDYDSQVAPGCTSSLEASEEFQEGEEDAAKRDGDLDDCFGPHTC